MSPHDALFKDVYGNPEHAAGALRAVMPAVIGEALDWATLTRVSGSFIDPVLRERHTDLLFSAHWNRGSDALVYLLFEHQSSPDEDMAFRILRYLIRIWERWRKDHVHAAALPTVMPVVLYHGSESWSAPRWFSALLDIPELLRPALAPHVVDFSYLVDDLSETSDDQLRARTGTALTTLTALCLKHARTHADFLAALAGWGDLLRAVATAPRGLEALALVMHYIVHVADVERDALAALVEREIGTRAKDTVMTLGERLIEEGRLKGLEEGLQQGLSRGLEQGRVQNMREVLRSLLEQRFGAEVDTETRRQISTASANQLDGWMKRLFSAGSLAELLA